MIKYILNTGGLLTGKMFIIDGLTMKTRIAEFPSKNKNCKVCSDKKFLTKDEVKNNGKGY